MKRPQFSLWWLLGATAIVAVACAGLINASNNWAVFLHSTMLGMLGVAVLRAIYRQAATRAFWVGFALFGWIYLALIYWVHYNSQFGDDFNTPNESELATTRLLLLAYDQVLPLVREPPAKGARAVAGSYPDLQNFLRVGQTLWALIVAFLGGLTARYLYRTGNQAHS